MIPNRGAWLKIETDSNDIIYVKIDKNRKILATTLLKAMGITVTEMESLFTHFEFLKKTLDKDTTETTDDALIDLYKKLRPGDPASAQGGRQILESRFFDDKKYDIGRVGRYKLNKKLNLNIPKNQRTLTVQDIVASIEYLINLTYDEGSLDDIDHLGNRRIRSVGELLQNQFRVGLSRVERIVKERMTLQDSETLTPLNLLNTKPLVASLKEFFGSSQLSQFMDQINPLAELTHKRRVSALGPGGLQRERAGFAVRDIHPSHYGRICPIETPEGPNAGLIGSLATHARVNDYGFVESPFFVVKDGKVTDEVVYMTADGEKCEILKFLCCTSNFWWQKTDLTPLEQQEFSQHLVNKITALGYLICDYKFLTELKAVIAMDGELSDVGQSNGRTGKSLIGDILLHIKGRDSRARVDGRNTKNDDDFVFSDVTLMSRVVFPPK